MQPYLHTTHIHNTTQQNNTQHTHRLVELMWDYMRLRRYLCGGQGSLQFSSESDCINPLLYNSRACALEQTPFPFCE